MRLNLKFFYNVPFLLLFSFLLRSIATYYFGDTEIEHEWLLLFRNLYNNGTLSFRVFDGNLIPSVYMPPLYAFFLLFLKLISPGSIEFIKFILFSQIILSIISIFIFYHLNRFFFSKNWSMFNSFVLAMFPLEIYAVTQVSSVTLQFLLLNLYLYLFFVISTQTKFSWKKIFYFSLVSGLLMLLRGEFYLIFIITLFFLIFSKRLSLQKSLIIFIISLLVLSPYLVRNYIVFNKITLTKSAGYNLWKGNNLYSTVEGAESYAAFRTIRDRIDNLPKDNLYDFHYDKLFLEESLNYIKKEPLIFVERYIKRFFTFFYFNMNSEYPNYYNPIFIIPILMVSIFSTIGILVSIKKINFKDTYLLLYLFSTICIFSIFFVLPRYKIIILPIQLIFMNYFLVECYKRMKFFNKRHNKK